MIDNASMPRSTIIPVLRYADVRGAVAWLTEHFGLRERLRIAEHRSQLTYGNGDLVVTTGVSVPGEQTLLVRVADVDAHFMHAQSRGVQIRSTPETFAFGERQYAALDCAGHVWTFSQSVVDVDPATWGGETVALRDDR